MAKRYTATIETPYGPRKGLQVVVPRDNKKPLMTHFGGIPLKRKQDAILVDRLPQFVMTNRSELLQRMLADTCEVITLDHLSHGRLILGVGLGDAQDLHFGEVADMKQRAEMLDEGLDLLTDLMSGQPFSYQGAHYQVNEVTFAPGPAQKPRVPIWLGGYWSRKARALRVARWDGFCPAKVPDEHGDGYIKSAD